MKFPVINPNLPKIYVDKTIWIPKKFFGDAISDNLTPFSEALDP